MEKIKFLLSKKTVYGSFGYRITVGETKLWARGGREPRVFDIPIDISKWMQLITVLIYRTSPTKSWTRAKTLKIRANKFIVRTCNFTKNYLKWLTLLKKSPLGIFQRFCFKVSEDLFYRILPFIFVVSRLCTVFLRQSRFM